MLSPNWHIVIAAVVLSLVALGLTACGPAPTVETAHFVPCRIPTLDTTEPQTATGARVVVATHLCAVDEFEDAVDDLPLSPSIVFADAFADDPLSALFYTPLDAPFQTRAPLVVERRPGALSNINAENVR
ncbi:MAG: hypothetical protein FWD69_06860 [Polyangiaceae bacterium]|nr:hypothetical protein [Polyangiaceae bacterium]